MASFIKTVVCSPVSMGLPGSIREAIAKLGGKPGTVLIEAGEYNILTPTDLITIPANTALVGLGNVTVNVKLPLSGALIRNTGFENITLSNINIVLYEEAAGYKDNLVFFQNVRNSSIERVTVIAKDAGLITGGVAILLYAKDGVCENNIISQCRVTNYGGQAFNMTTHPEYTFPWPHTCNHNIIRDCYTNQVLTGCCISRADYNSVLNNIFINSLGDRSPTRKDHINQGHDGLLIQGNGNRAIGNNLSGNSEHGLYLSGSQDSVFQGNICNDNECAGIHVRYADEGENVIEDCLNVISGNICNGNGKDPTGGGCGIQMQEHAHHNIVTGNICNGNNGDGLRIHGAGATDNMVGGNLCYDNASNQISIETAGNHVLDDTFLTYYIGD